ncbi:sugar-phosphatase [Clostridium sp. SYSU_GA19001]|uniref:sugar-phosphatase n=1 Tax=Clostridium caldaquaticum TaxID=2940653 RepID=UPI0020771B86|nr:sugar-phosphatase [Clostridium caldaquaticum]MCM8709880.1 sugar-phosphatase [Clostridium caldaquaticum]
MYKLIALDMDGTLLKDDRTISKETFKAIQRAKAKGVKVVLSTGRPMIGIKNYLKQLDLVNEDDYAVAYNGALVQNTKTGRIVAQNPMTLEDLNYLYDLSKKLEVNIHFLTDSSCVTPKWSKYSQVECDINNIPMEIVDFTKIDENTSIVKIMFIDEPHILDRVINQLPEEVYNKFSVLRSAPYFLEFLNKKVNKGYGIELLAKTLGIKREEIICVGDAGNDIAMIQFAGLGVAMGNAFPEVKDIADYVTLSNEEHGVAHVINKFVLGIEKAS